MLRVVGLGSLLWDLAWPCLLPTVSCLLAGCLCADALGAGSKLLRLGSPAGLLADLGQPLKYPCREGMVRPEFPLADCQRLPVELLGFSIAAVAATDTSKRVGNSCDVWMLRTQDSRQLLHITYGGLLNAVPLLFHVATGPPMPAPMAHSGGATVVPLPSSQTFCQCERNTRPPRSAYDLSAASPVVSFEPGY